jgi:hypothetical protein
LQNFATQSRRYLKMTLSFSSSSASLRLCVEKIQEFQVEVSAWNFDMQNRGNQLSSMA